MPDFDYEWLIMLYLSGDNNLSAEMVRAVKEVETVGLPEKVALTIQYDALSQCYPTLRYALPPTEGLAPPPHAGTLLIQNADITEVKSDDSANPKVLARFITESAGQFSARHRLLVLSGHGSGAVGDFLVDETARQRQKGSLTIRQLRRALETAQVPIEILGMDSCLMSMAEVCYEVSQPPEGRERGFVDYVVGSEGFVPNSGWPYGHLLECLKTRVTDGEPLDPKAIASCLVADYVSFYEDYLSADISVDMAAIELSTLNGLADALRTLTTIVGRYLAVRTVQNMVVLAHWRAQSFKLEQYTDLWDFCDQLKQEAESSGHSDIVEACERVKDAVALSVGGRQKFAGIDFQHTHGLSVYFPWSRPAFADRDYLEEYGHLAFPTRSGWHEFLSNYVAATTREQRVLPPVPGAAPGIPLEFPAIGAPFLRSTRKNGIGFNRFLEGYNRFLEGYNRFLIDQVGARSPWSMKNPPQGVVLPPAVPGGPRPKTRPAGTHQAV